MRAKQSILLRSSGRFDSVLHCVNCPWKCLIKSLYFWLDANHGPKFSLFFRRDLSLYWWKCVVFVTNNTLNCAFFRNLVDYPSPSHLVDFVQVVDICRIASANLRISLSVCTKQAASWRFSHYTMMKNLKLLLRKVWVEYFKLFWYYSNAFKSAKIHIEFLMYV